MRRIVENQDFLVTQESLRQTEPLQISLGQRFHFFVAMLGESEQLDSVADALMNLAVRNPRQRGVAHESSVRAPFRWNGDELRQVTDAVALDVMAGGQAVDLHGPCRRPQIAKHHGDERCFAGAVGTGDAEYLALGDHQRKLLDRFYGVAEE